MKIFFRKHGNSLFYILLPVLFLVLTIAFIQLTPRSSQTAPGDACTDNGQCCTSSGCGSDTGEACQGDTCKRTNVGCVEGTINDTANGCTCEVNGQVVGQCVVCQLDEVFFEGACVRLCGPGEDPATTGCINPGCIQGDGGFGSAPITKVDCDGSGCALNPTATLADPSLLLAGLGLFATTWWVSRKRRA